MGLKPHFMISESDGGLYDTRAADWSRAPLRPGYARTHARIQTVAQFKATLRAGGYAWPGGYALALLCSDGGALCFDCGRAEARAIMDSIQGGHRDGWRVAGCFNAEESESPVICDHCAGVIGGGEEESE